MRFMTTLDLTDEARFWGVWSQQAPEAGSDTREASALQTRIWQRGMESPPPPAL